MPCPLAFWATWRTHERPQGRLDRVRYRHRATWNQAGDGWHFGLSRCSCRWAGASAEGNVDAGYLR